MNTTSMWTCDDIDRTAIERDIPEENIDLIKFCVDNRHLAHFFSLIRRKLESKTLITMLTFSEIEDCFPEYGGDVNENGITVSASWLHNFAYNIMGSLNNKLRNE